MFPQTCEAHLQREGHLRGLHDSEGRPLIPVLMYDKKARTAVAVRALFAAFSRGADQQSANANIPVFDVCSVICCFFALFPCKNPAESICSLRDF